MEIVIPDVVVRDTGTAKGMGVFAKASLKQGQVVELCPIITFKAPFKELPQEVMTRVFDWAVLANAPGTHAIALGFGSMYNHQNPANMRYEATCSGRFLQFVAVRDIEAGDELTINYNGLGGSHESGGNHWFERTGVTPIG